MDAIDSPDRLNELVAILNRKKSLKSIYGDFYSKILESYRSLVPQEGQVLELGSGAGFLKEYIPEAQTSDILPYENIDLVVDATQLQFQNSSLKFICMINTFHHIADVETFLKEAQRCLVKGGKVFMIDQHHGLISRFIYKYLHHEPYDANATQWKFESSGPLSDANGALAWIVFKKEIHKFHKLYPNLKCNSYRPHTALLYWLAGGLKSWSLLPPFLYPAFAFFDSLLCKISPSLGSFVSIELEKV